MSFKYALGITTGWADDHLRESLASVPPHVEVEVVNNRERGWFLAQGWNYLMKKYLVEQGYEALVIANDDIVYDRDTLDILVDCLLRRQFQEPRMPRELLVVKTWSRNNRKYHPANELTNGWRQWHHEGWYCFATSRKLVDVCGYFDEQFPAGGEDSDMAIRIRLNGYADACYPGLIHYGGTSTGNHAENGPAFNANEQARIDWYNAKYDGKLFELKDRLFERDRYENWGWCENPSYPE